MSYQRIKLEQPYSYLEPYISEEIVRKHYENNHKAYEVKLNAAIEGRGIQERFGSLESLMKSYQKIEDPIIKVAIRQFGGGLLNHNFLFPSMKKDVEFKDGLLKTKILNQYGTIERFKAEYKEAVLNLFGSGWIWFVVGKSEMLNIIKVFNQDTPQFLGFTPLFGIDVWEHAFIFQFDGDKGAYFDAIWKCIDWDFVEEQYVNKK